MSKVKHEVKVVDNSNSKGFKSLKSKVKHVKVNDNFTLTVAFQISKE